MCIDDEGTCFLKNQRYIISIFISALTLVLITNSAVYAADAAVRSNYLKTKHEDALFYWQRKAASAATPWNVVFAKAMQAGELDSLGRSDDALKLIDAALSTPEGSKAGTLRPTKAGVLFSLDRPAEALAVLQPEIDRLHALVVSNKEQGDLQIMTGIFSEGFIDAAFAHMELEQWRDAAANLADAHAPLEGPRFDAYRALVYRYIKARAGDVDLGQPSLDKLAEYYAAHDVAHYGVLLRLWRGEDVSVQVDALLQKTPSSSDEQDTLAEVLFYSAAYAAFVRHDDAKAKKLMVELNALEPYGNVEWIYAKRVIR